MVLIERSKEMFERFRKGNKQQRDAPQKRGVMTLVNGDAEDILFNSGYSPVYKNEEVRKCAHKIADLVSNMTIMLMQNSKHGDIRVKNGLSHKLDIEPNKLMTRKQFIYKIVSDMIDYGNAVVYPVIKEGYIDDLVILDMDGVSYREKGDTYFVRYKGKEYGCDEVLHFVLIPDRQKPWRGVGYAPQIIDTIKNLGQANATKASFLKSKWKPSLIISVMGDAEELQDPDKRNAILDSYIDNTEVGKPWLIPADEVKVQEVRPLTLQDLNLHESITLDKKVVAGTFGVPAFLLGIGEFNIDEYNNFISNVICSFGLIIQQEFTKKLLYDPTLYFKFSPRSLLQYNLNDKTNHVKELVNAGMLSRNEGRNEFDYSPVDVEGMDDYNVLENYIPVDKVGEQKKLGGVE